VKASPAAAALDLRIRGIVQGVGFRPFVYRLAARYALSGWVLNGESGVEIHAEGDPGALGAFARAVVEEAPPDAWIAGNTPCGGQSSRTRQRDGPAPNGFVCHTARRTCSDPYSYHNIP